MFVCCVQHFEILQTCIGNFSVVPMLKALFDLRVARLERYRNAAYVRLLRPKLALPAFTERRIHDGDAISRACNVSAA